jgi:hypothetical protein
LVALSYAMPQLTALVPLKSTVATLVLTSM